MDRDQPSLRESDLPLGCSLVAILGVFQLGPRESDAGVAHRIALAVPAMRRYLAVEKSAPVAPQELSIRELVISSSLNLKHASHQRGSALVLALLVVMLVAMLGGSLLRLTSAVTRRQSAEVERTKAFYLAEAGLAESFQAVRVGRTGQIGSEAAPARYGNGLIWVDATETADGLVRLESTGMIGRGRSTLAFIVEPVELSLGFFSDEDLVIESVVLADGFDSEELGYWEEVAILEEKPPEQVDEGDKLSAGSLMVMRTLIDRVGYEVVSGELERNNPSAPQYLSSLASLKGTEAMQVRDAWPELVAAHQAGTLEGDLECLDSPDDDSSLSAPVIEAVSLSQQGPTTGSGGLLSSNGSISFTSEAGGPVEVFGDVKPGPLGSVDGLGPVMVTGSTDSRSTGIELPVVEIPDVALAMPVRHESLLPMVVSAGTSGYESIEVAPDSELILYGPATIVIGQLTLDPGALLTLDTRNGDVELYITGGMDLQPDSVVSTSGEMPDEVSVQVAQIPTFDTAPVNLEATSQFYGTIYAPGTEVKIGTDFEIYGGVVARKLQIGPGARLHFDSSGFEGSAIPRIVSWKIIELPAAIRGHLGDPFSVLGVEQEDLEDLSEAHDLTAVWLTLTYVGNDGIQYTYSGTEDGFDWTTVAEIVSLERDPTRPVEDEPDLPADEETSDGGIRPEIQDALDSMTGSSLKSFLIANNPMTEAELLVFIADDKMNGGLEKGVLMASIPLPESVLTSLVQNPDGVYDPDGGGWLNPDGIDRGLLADVLVANSPLPQSTLDAVAAAAGTLLSDVDKATILAAQ